MYPVENLYVFLAGNWRIERDFTDRRSGKHGHFHGSATFSQCPSPRAARGVPADPSDHEKPAIWLDYSERIQTELDDYSGTSSQRYRYCFDGIDQASARAVVSFSDGRFFHDLDLASGICRVQHLCEADTYEGVFRCVTENEWRLRWKVTGPRKHYIIESRFLRKHDRNSGASADV